MSNVVAGRYALLQERGRGGMATVYLAEDLKLGRRIALKLLRSDVPGAIGAERFLLETAIASRLTHPHILALHDPVRPTANSSTPCPTSKVSRCGTGSIVRASCRPTRRGGSPLPAGRHEDARATLPLLLTSASRSFHD
jgi:serine/threonine protein kinase